MKTRLFPVLVALWGLSAAGQADALTLPDPQGAAVLYGNAFSYSLSLLNVSPLYGNTTNTPSAPYYVDSTPGAIKDQIVIATGASGSGVNTNLPGMNNAYATPSGQGGAPYFSTGQAHPSAQPGLILDNPTTWNTNISALSSFLGTGNVPVFFFNNNQVNSGSALDQQLVVWGQASLVSSTAAAPTQYFTLANQVVPVGVVGIDGSSVFVGDGIRTGGILSPPKDPSAYSAGAPNNSYPLGTPGSAPALSDFVVSGGQVCLDGSGGVVECSDPTAVTTVNNNLGANQAAYAVIVPALNDFLASWDTTSPYDVLEVDLRMGCNPAFYPGGVCPEGTPLNNGFEQVFLMAGQVEHDHPNQPVPEPGTLVLVGLGLGGLGLLRRRQQR